MEQPPSPITQKQRAVMVHLRAKLDALNELVRQREFSVKKFRSALMTCRDFRSEELMMLFQRDSSKGHERGQCNFFIMIRPRFFRNIDMRYLKVDRKDVTHILPF